MPEIVPFSIQQEEVHKIRTPTVNRNAKHMKIVLYRMWKPTKFSQQPKRIQQTSWNSKKGIQNSSKCGPLPRSHKCMSQIKTRTSWIWRIHYSLADKKAPKNHPRRFLWISDFYWGQVLPTTKTSQYLQKNPNKTKENLTIIKNKRRGKKHDNNNNKKRSRNKHKQLT